MTEFTALISAFLVLAIGVVSLVGIDRNYELIPRWSIPGIFVSGYLAGCIGLVTLGTKFAASKAACFISYSEAYLHGLILIPAGFVMGIIAIGFTALLARHHKSWPLLPVALIAVTHLAFWFQRDRFLSAEGFVAQNRWDEVVAMAATPDRQSEDAFRELLDHGRESQIPETSETRELMYGLLGVDVVDHQQIAIDVIADGKRKLSPEALFQPGDGHNLARETWQAKHVVKALLERTRRNSVDPALESAWQNLYSKSRQYQVARNAKDAKTLKMINLSRTNAVGQIWQTEIAKAAKAEPVVARWLKP